MLPICEEYLTGCDRQGDILGMSYQLTVSNSVQNSAILTTNQQLTAENTHDVETYAVAIGLKYTIHQYFFKKLE